MEDQFFKSKRNLIGISAVLIIFNLAGGKLNDTLTIFGGSIEFSNPQYLIYFVWGWLFYTFWQFWVNSLFIRVKIKSVYEDYLYNKKVIFYLQSKMAEYLLREHDREESPETLTIIKEDVKISLTSIEMPIPYGGVSEKILKFVPTILDALKIKISPYVKILFNSDISTEFFIPLVIFTCAVFVGVINYLNA